jgi:hypothetical protein
MTDICTHSNSGPVTSALLQGVPHFGIQFDRHGGIFAKFCDKRKQPIARAGNQTARMVKKPVNQVLAEALRSFMGTKWNNLALANAAGVGEATIRNYLAPLKRMQGASGKAPSAKLAEVELLADALGVTVADLVTDASEEQRRVRHRAHAAAYYEKHGRLPTWAPAATPAQLDVSVSLQDAAA